MLITCKCLNVAINTKNCDIQNVDISNLGLSSEELKDNFFQEVRESVRYAACMGGKVLLILYKRFFNIFVGCFHRRSGKNIERAVKSCSSTKCGKLDHSPLSELLNKYTCNS
jgi:hypothetical protein